MSILKVIGQMARDVNSIAHATRNVTHLADEFKQRKAQKQGRRLLGEPEGHVRKRELNNFKVRVVSGLIDAGWSDVQIAKLTGASVADVTASRAIYQDVGASAGTCEDDVAF